MMRICMDPDPQHWLFHCLSWRKGLDLGLSLFFKPQEIWLKGHSHEKVCDIITGTYMKLPYSIGVNQGPPTCLNFFKSLLEDLQFLENKFVLV
jgi:hypothetical protein